MLEETYPIRTDLALESQERLKKKRGAVKGVQLQEEERGNGVVVSTVIIETENAARAMGRPRGTYVTIEAPEMVEEDEGYHRDISLELARIIRQMLPEETVRGTDAGEEPEGKPETVRGTGATGRPEGKPETVRGTGATGGPEGKTGVVREADITGGPEGKTDAVGRAAAAEAPEGKPDSGAAEGAGRKMPDSGAAEDAGRKMQEKGRKRDTPAGLADKLAQGLDVSVLVVGLGNREVTPDALGPRVVDNLFITRHIMNEFGRYAFSDEDVSKISGIVPGVMAQTGMECVEILRGVVRETQPDFVITVDALAARNVKRLGRTIQLTDTGITPGSGIGNHRNAINRASIGVPVISLGVPTVVDAATIVSDAMTTLIEAMSLSDLQGLDERERQELARELLSPQLNGLFVTPKNIDASIKTLSFLISEGLNVALLGDKESGKSM